MTAKKIEAWSFSRLQDYRKCPKLAKFKHVDRLKEPGNAAMERGSAIDKAGEDFIMGRTKKLIPELKTFEAEFKELRKRGAKAQEQWAFNMGWKPVDWFARDAWLRIKTDVLLVTPETSTALVVDNKTGKQREEHAEQVKLYALGTLLTLPEVQTVDARIWYTDLGIESPEEPQLYTRKDETPLKTYWLKQVKSMLADTRFAPRPGNHCRYCHFRKDNGGPCEH